MDAKKEIKNIIKYGSNQEKKKLYGFDGEDSIERIYKKFQYFVRGNFPNYFKHESAPFHKEMIVHYIKSYLGEENYLNIGFRGCAKTTIKKLFDAYVLLNDGRKDRRHYIKVLTSDIQNSKQIVTDVYNLIVEVEGIYGNAFDGGDGKKREETMKSFTMQNGVKYLGGTVGQRQRGHAQAEFRPDWLWFEDIEDSETIRSLVQTESIVAKCDEAIQGMSDDGSYVVTANYISDQGSIEWFKQKKTIVTHITPIIDADGKSTWSKNTPEKIAKIKDDADDWEGDYLCDPSKAQDAFFNRVLVDRAIKLAADQLKMDGLVKVWDTYKPHHKYGIGGDTSEGEGRDANALSLFDYTKSALIGTYYSADVAPDLFGYEMMRLGNNYGSCILAPEVNNTGHATVAALKSESYPNIYRQVEIEKTADKQTDKLGWRTTSRTKHEAWYGFKKDFEDGNITIYDIEFLQEMRAFTQTDFAGKTKGILTRHFDLLTSGIIGWQARSQSYKKPERKKRRVRRVKNALHRRASNY